MTVSRRDALKHAGKAVAAVAVLPIVATLAAGSAPAVATETTKAEQAARMYHYWRTASTELVALAPKAPYIGPERAFEGQVVKGGAS